MEKLGKGATGRVHAVIVVSESPEQRQARAEELAASLLCESPAQAPCGSCRHCRKLRAGVHPDVTTLVRGRDEKGRMRREIVVEQIRSLTAEAHVRPNEAEYRVFLIPDAGFMNPAAQNAFLKLLEEPPGPAYFLLCADNAELLLPTIRSRCALVRAGTEEEVPAPEATESARAYLRALEQGAAALLRCCTQLEKMDAQAMTAFVEAARVLICEMLCGRTESGLDRAELLRQERLLSRMSDCLRLHVGVRHICGLLAVQRSAAQTGGREF